MIQICRYGRRCWQAIQNPLNPTNIWLLSLMPWGNPDHSQLHESVYQSRRMFCYSEFYSGRGETVALHLSVCRTNSGLGCLTGWVWLTWRNYFSPSVNRYHLWDDIQITLWCSFGCLTGETKKNNMSWEVYWRLWQVNNGWTCCDTVR